jgi:hypothetical protein
MILVSLIILGQMKNKSIILVKPSFLCYTMDYLLIRIYKIMNPIKELEV